MKASGIIRRIDDLGRIVIPKEIRRAGGIREGTPMEIFPDKDGSILLKKYQPDVSFLERVKCLNDSVDDLADEMSPEEIGVIRKTIFELTKFLEQKETPAAGTARESGN